MVKRVGFFSFTCCEGCIVVFLEALNKKYDEWMQKIKIENFRALKKVQPISPMDIAFIEGAISTPSEINKLKLIRKNTKILIALGSGASNGYPSNQRNKFSIKKKQAIQPLIKKLNQNPTIEPLNKFVKVDDKVPGCPIGENMLIKKIDGYLKNAQP